jgi:glycosyltransferase involved in cell wall biosynthesis
VTDQPTISVVIPTYNRARVLPRAVRSVLGQTYVDFELIVVDDGSTDDTHAAVAAFSDRRLRAIHAAHAGQAAARNQGVSVARGEWIAFLDDDNEWRADYLERQLAVAERTPGVGVVYCLTEVRLQGSADVSSRGYPEWCPTGDVFDDFLAGWWAPVSGMIMRRATLAEVGGFSEDLAVFDEYDLMMQVALRTSFGCNPEVLVVREERREESAQLLENLSRSIVVLARKWRGRIVRRGGYRVYLRWIWLRRRFVIRQELRWLYSRDHAEARSSALTSLRRLSRQLPWSALGASRTFVVFLLGARADARLRGGVRRLRRAAR